MSRFSKHLIKQNDLLPPIAAVLSYVGGSARNLTGCTVKFLMRARPGATPKVNATATVVDAATGAVRYDWIAGDTNTPGEWQAEFEVTQTAGGRKETFPNDSYITVLVTEEIG